MVGRDDKDGEELINEFKVVREEKVEKWKRCGEGEEIKDEVRELVLVN